MGGAESVPAPDLRVKRAMAIAKMDMKDVGKFWKKFRKLDKEMRGNIDVEDFYEAIEEQRSIYGDGIFELLDITHAGSISFGEFIQSIIVMCLFEVSRHGGEGMGWCFLGSVVVVFVVLCECPSAKTRPNTPSMNPPYSTRK